VEVGKLPRQTRKPKKLWLWWSGGSEADLDLLWKAYCRRFDLEHTIRFLKQTLGWSAPRFRHPEQADRWTRLVLLAYAQLRLARGIVADRRLPWERPQRPRRLTPTRVLRNFATLTPGERRYSSGVSETVRQISRASERQWHGAGQTLSGTQKCRLSKPVKLGFRRMLVSPSSRTTGSA
jgi:hypothetical protein